MTQKSDPASGYNEQLRALAQSLDCFTEQDICALCNITPLTLEAWRKRRRGPRYTLLGNRFLYPRAAVREFIESQLRERPALDAKAVL